MEVKWISYKGCRILYADYRGAKNELQVLEVLSKFDREMDLEIEKAQTENNPSRVFLSFVNLQDVFVSGKYMDESSRMTKKWFSKLGTWKAFGAVVGVQGIKKVLYDGYVRVSGNKLTKAFDTEEAAKEWLVSNK